MLPPQSNLCSATSKMDIPKPKRERSRRVCEHCDQELSKTHYYEHRKRYFINGVWIREVTVGAPLSTAKLTPLRRVDGLAAEQCYPESTNDDLEKKLLSAFSGWSQQVTQLITQVAADLKGEMAEIKARLLALEEQQPRPNCSCGEDQKRKRRVHNPMVAEKVRRLHNSDENDRRYEPEQGLNSSHNEAVTSHLMATLTGSSDMDGVDRGVLLSACKTYYETVRRSFRYAQPALSDQAAALKVSARSRQRRKRLLEARRSVLATQQEIDFWQGVTADMMSDEEDDDTAEGEAGWIVKPPSFRSQALSQLCQTLQERLESDPKYVVTHRKRLRIESPSKRQAPSQYDPEAAKKHFQKP
ncbi:uncharacterized protein C14orf93-like [Chaetodon trifascialis]|uniref:uncharacterized protein C14orf93-like n=1 Tax=Chaetodon trifascialis TaxID=109706 RepID=UPI003993A185